MLLDETKEWKYVGSKMTCETDGKTKDKAYSKTLDETDDKQNEKDDLGPVISMENRIVTLAPPIPFTSPKVNFVIIVVVVLNQDGVGKRPFRMIFREILQ
jgi:hypothetical protein